MLHARQSDIILICKCRIIRLLDDYSLWARIREELIVEAANLHVVKRALVRCVQTQHRCRYKYIDKKQQYKLGRQVEGVSRT